MRVVSSRPQSGYQRVDGFGSDWVRVIRFRRAHRMDVVAVDP